MPRNRLLKIVLGAAILLAVIAVGLALGESRLKREFLLFETPKIEMTLGDDWGAITAHSTYPFRDIAGHRDGYATDREPVNFVYTNPRHRIELPNARTVYFDLEDDHVTNVRVLQWGTAGDWDAIQGQVRALVAQIERAGWARTDGKTLDDALAGRKAFYDEHRDFMNDQFLGAWHADGERFDLSLYRTRNAGDTVGGVTSANDMFVINVSIVPDD